MAKEPKAKKGNMCGTKHKMPSKKDSKREKPEKGAKY